MLSGIGPMELIVVAVIALLILGPKRLPGAGKSIGHGLREFKSAIAGDKPDDDDDLNEAELSRLTAAEPEREPEVAAR
jgi:sec-independent protein translocase protein TatA